MSQRSQKLVVKGSTSVLELTCAWLVITSLLHKWITSSYTVCTTFPTAGFYCDTVLGKENVTCIVRTDKEGRSVWIYLWFRRRK